MMGPGLNLRIKEGERTLTKDRYYVDLFMYYYIGSFSKTPKSTDKKEFDGLMFGLTFVK